MAPNHSQVFVPQSQIVDCLSIFLGKSKSACIAIHFSLLSYEERLVDNLLLAINNSHNHTLDDTKTPSRVSVRLCLADHAVPAKIELGDISAIVLFKEESTTWMDLPESLGVQNGVIKDKNLLSSLFCLNDVVD